MGIFNTISVDIDIDDVKYDVLESLTDEELVEEIENRDMVCIRKKFESGELIGIDKLYFSRNDLYRHLCDICDCGYHEPKESLLNKLRELM